MAIPGGSQCQLPKAGSSHRSQYRPSLHTSQPKPVQDGQGAIAQQQKAPNQPAPVREARYQPCGYKSMEKGLPKADSIDPQRAIQKSQNGGHYKR